MQQRESLAVADLSPWRIVLALASGLLLAFSFPPLDLGWLAWLAIAPLLIAIRGLRPAQGFTLGLLCGFVYFGILLHYIHGVSTTIPWIALILFQSLFLSIFGFLAAVMWRCPSPWIRIPALGAAWTAHEIIRGNFGPLGFTFGHLGYSQHRLLWVLQLASLGGHYGLGFAIATFQAALVEAIPRFDYRGRPATGGPLVILTSLLVAACIWGGARVSRQRDLVLKGSLDVTAVQGNIDYSAEDGYDQLVDLSAARYIVRSQNDGAGSDLIVWPETAIPIPLESFPDTREWIASTAKRINSHIFVGVAETAPGGSRYNSMWVIDPNGDKIATYRKRYLVIFGEYVPFREQLPWLAKFPIRSFDFLPGRADLVLPINGIRVSPMICFEGTFPQISRRLVQKGAEILVIITSDDWVGNNPSELGQHSQCSTLRAVETGRWLVRAAGTGVTRITDPVGQIIAEAPILEQASVRAHVGADIRRTLFQTVGLWPMTLIICLLLIAGLADLFSGDPVEENAY